MGRAAQRRGARGTVKDAAQQNRTQRNSHNLSLQCRVYHLFESSLVYDSSASSASSATSTFLNATCSNQVWFMILLLLLLLLLPLLFLKCIEILFFMLLLVRRFARAGTRLNTGPALPTGCRQCRRRPPLCR
jgi:hypothetical protein